jgi:VanZ family protein
VFRAWIAVILWGGVVWALGGDAFSAAFTAKVLRPIIELFVADFSTADMFVLLTVVRKSMHVAVYGLLALLILRALWMGSVDSLLLSLGLTALLVTTMALADETRQSFSAVRTGSGWDVMLDLIGAAGVAALLTLQAKHRRPLFAPERGR